MIGEDQGVKATWSNGLMSKLLLVAANPEMLKMVRLNRRDIRLSK
jgi:hypothetical protein